MGALSGRQAALCFLVAGSCVAVAPLPGRTPAAVPGSQPVAWLELPGHEVEDPLYRYPLETAPRGRVPWTSEGRIELFGAGESAGLRPAEAKVAGELVFDTRDLRGIGGGWDLRGGSRLGPMLGDGPVRVELDGSQLGTAPRYGGVEALGALRVRVQGADRAGEGDVRARLTRVDEDHFRLETLGRERLALETDDGRPVELELRGRWTLTRVAGAEPPG